MVPKELAEQAEREACLQGLKLSDIIAKALTAYLRSQTNKRRESRYLLWHVEREYWEGDKEISQ